ncbi:MAG: hypothetical protein ACREYF_23535 [Gammaproteobacteria bacterium]
MNGSITAWTLKLNCRTSPPLPRPQGHLLDTGVPGFSGSGQNKLPLAGKSCPVGGVTLNRAIAESLIKRVPGLRELQVKTALREYKEWNKGRRTFEALDRRYRMN